ncbi:MAG: nitroreductase family protein [Fusobacteriaceae bacterium]|nr:nitroreductase family protein [Fusobacteriaceae bacterium]MBN2837139.1 nitroreductase family protein [Fusobacteriaceae bacterium]
MDILEIIKGRRSVRSYEETKVEKEKIEKIMEAGLWAPSAHNHQSWSFVVIENKDIIEELNVDTKNVMKNYKIEQFRKWGENEKFNIFYNSPVVILVLYDESGLVPMQDISVASQNMLLTAHTLGLGTCWIGMVSIGFSDESMQQKYKEKLNLPDGYKISHAISLGYPKTIPAKGPERKENKVIYID